MAKRGSIKDLSVRQEEYIASMYQGRRSKSSGGAGHDQGDVRSNDVLYECKFTGSPANPLKAMPKLLKEFEKVTKEAFSEAREPAMCLRFYEPRSILADVDGWVDLTVRCTRSDAEREKWWRQWLWTGR